MRLRMAVWTYSGNTTLDIDSETKEFMIDGENVDYSQGFLVDAISLVKDWPDHLEDPEMHDGIAYKITYNDGKTERTVTGNNKTPSNFSLLMYMVNEYTPKTEEELEEEKIEQLIEKARKDRDNAKGM